MAEVVITVRGKDESKGVFNAVKDSATSAFDKVKSAGKSAFADLKNIVSDFKAHWLGVTAAIGAAWLAATKMWNLAEQSAQFEQSRQAFTGMVQSMGRDAEVEFGKIRAASAGLIDDKSLVESANKAMSLGIPIEKLGQLMEIARAKARDMGTTATSAFNDIAIGIGRGSPLILDNLGLVIKLGDAYETYAKTINKTVEQLSDQDKKTALLNATIDAGTEALERHNLAALTGAEKLQKLTAKIENLKLQAGAFVMKGGLALYGLFQSIAAAALAGSAGIFRLASGLGWLSDKIGLTKGAYKEWKLQADSAWEASKGLGKEALDNMSSLFAKTEDVVAAQKKSKRAADAAAKSVIKSADAAKKAYKGEEKQLQGRLNAWEGYYSNLKSMQSKAASDQKRLAKELISLEKKITGQRQGYTDLIASLDEKMWGDKLSASEKYYREQDRLDDQLSSAMKLSGQTKIDALMKYQQSSAAAARQVKEDGEIIIGIEEATFAAMSQVEKAQGAILKAQNDLKAAKEEELADVETWISTLDSAMTRAEGMVTDYQKQITALHQKMMGMGMNVDNDQATRAINNVKSALDAIPNVTTKTVYLETITSGGGPVMASGGGESSDLTSFSLDSRVEKGSYAVGTRYVPKTGIYQLHQGEEVHTSKEVSQNNSRQSNKVEIRIGDIVIQGNNKSPEQIAREIARPLRKELTNLNKLLN